jgi:hypothetical protein
VNNSRARNWNRLIWQAHLSCSPVFHRRGLVNKLCISIHCKNQEKRYDVRSSLKEPRRMAANKIVPEISKIIPGDWGKVGSGWLTRLLWTGAQVSARQNSPVPLARSRVPVTRKTELGGEERLEAAPDQVK